MNVVKDYLRNAWLLMFTPPWRRSVVIDSLFSKALYVSLSRIEGASDETIQHPKTAARIVRWFAWLMGWSWFLAGALLGAFIALPLLRGMGLANTPYHDYIAIGSATVIGFIVQLLGWLVMALTDWVGTQKIQSLSLLWAALLSPLGALLSFWPLIGVGYGVFRALTLIGPEQRAITVATVGSLLLKVLVMPVLNAIVARRGFALWMRWLRGDTRESA